MASKSINPYRPPENQVRVDRLARPNTVLASLATLAVALYALFSLALLAGDSRTDTWMGIALLGNLPLMSLWLGAIWGVSRRVAMLGWASSAVQVGICICMLSLVPDAPRWQTLVINAIAAAMVLSLTIVCRFSWMSDSTEMH